MKRKKVSELAKQIRGVSYKTEDLHENLDENSVTLLRANNIFEGRINFDDVVYVDKSRVAREQYLCKGDILVCASSGSKQLVGKAASFNFDTECTFGAFCKVVRPNQDVANYLSMYFQSNAYRRKISEVAIGANINNIRNEHIDALELPIGSNAENEKVVASFSLLQQIIDGRKQQLHKLDELIKARFVELFGDPVSNPKAWEMVSLGKRCEIVTGNTPSRAEPENYGEFIEWIKSDNINTPFTFVTKAQEYLSEAGFKKCRFVEAGSLLMTCIAGSINCIGNVAVTDRRVAFNQQINAIVPEQDEVLYLYWLMLLSKPAIHGTINMALKGILSKGQLAKLTFPFPPIELQEQFAAFVEQVDKSKVAVQKALDEAQLLFDSLMQKYFG